MAAPDIPLLRLANQHLIGKGLGTPAEVVRHMGVVQAQDYRGGLWAVGCRMPGATEAAVEAALADRSIIRTWPVRGTLHLVTPRDARVLLPLLTPRIVARAAGRFRQLGLTAADFTRARKLLEKALRDGKALSRPAVYKLMEASGLSPQGQRGIHLLWRLAQEGVICYGPRDGKQQTFVLLDDWVPPVPGVPRAEAVADLAQRYFTSHGPAAAADFAWWAGLTLREAGAALEEVKGRLSLVVAGDRTLWGPSEPPAPRTAPARSRGGPPLHILPPFDELLVAYKDRVDSAQGDVRHDPFSLLSPALVAGGLVVGTWTRREDKKGVRIVPRWFVKQAAPRLRAFQAAAARYGEFLGRPAALDV